MKFLKPLFLMLAAFLPALAHAQANIFEPVPGDKALVILASIFGKLGVFGTSGADAFVEPMNAFLGGVLAVGGILVAYTIFAGTLATAHDGEMLGKKFSSVWVPIRTALGTALVLPVVGGGYCVMQVIVGWLIVQGIGLADKTWSSFVSSSNLVKVSSVGLQKPEVSELGANLFQSLVCVEALKEAANSEAGKVLIPGVQFGMTNDSGALTKTVAFGATNGLGGFRSDVCGKVEIAKFQTPVTGPQSGSAIGMVMNGGAAVARMSEIATEHENQVAQLINAMQPLAAELVKTKKPIAPERIDSAVAAYEEAVRTKAATVIAEMKPFEEVSKNAANDGFITAGAWMMKLAYMTDLVNRSMSNVATASGAKATGGGVFGESFAQVYPAMMDSLIKTKGGVANFGVGNEQGGSNTGWWDAVKDSVAGGLDPIPLMKKAFTSGTNFAIQDGEHPLLATKRLGNWLLGIAGTAYIAKAGLLATIGNAPGVGLLIAVTAIMTLPVFVLTGFALSFVLPNLPFIMWIGVVVGYLILCVEAIVAAPIWAVMHLHPNGDDVAGKGANGYNLVLSLVLRPVLMVFGFAAALIMLSVVGDFINKIFADVFVMNQQDSGFFIWLASFIAGPIIYCIVMFKVISKLFTIMYMIPDQLLNWFSGGGAQLGRTAEAVGGTQTYIAANTGIQQAIQTGEGLGQLKKQNDKLNESLQVENEQKDMARTKNFDDLDKELGSGTAAIAKFAEDQAGGAGTKEGGYAMQATTAKLREAIDHVGGKDSLGGAAFMSRLNESIKKTPDKPVQEHIASALNKGLNAEFGEGVGRVAGMIGNGYQGPEFNRAVKTFKDMAQKLKDQGLSSDEAKQSLGEAAQKTFADFHNDPASKKNGGTNSVQSYLQNNLQSLVVNKDLDEEIEND
ncbi:DotA/TraY family protein [Roseateles sp. PN1]|uniref:DotA/TraY family protein n=1 Tax=Roseateles sp. PN1 TaxID=3137372 RepID=UPI0031386C32